MIANTVYNLIEYFVVIVHALKGLKLATYLIIDSWRLV